MRNFGKILGVICSLALVGGCEAPGVIFPPVNPPVVWPKPPEPKRISYVGQLVTDQDLKPGKSFFDSVGQAIFGKSPARSMLTPFGICTDGKNRVFVADSNHQVVHVFDLETRKYAMWQPSEKQKFSQPVGAAWDPAGRLLVSDPKAGSVFVFDSNGKLLAEWGRGVLKRPCGVAVDAEAQRVLVVDTDAHQLVVFSMSGQVTMRIGTRGTDLGNFNFPTYVAVDRTHRVYICDSLNFRVQQFSADFKPIRQIGSHGDSPGFFSMPKGIAVDSDDHLYVVDSNFEAVQIFDSQGKLLLDFGEEGSGPGEFWLPANLYIDANNRIWVADCYNRRVQVFDYHPQGAPTTRPETKP